MSYARFSSDDYQSDVYCYRARRWFVIHVAVKRPQFKKALPEPIAYEKDPRGYMVRFQEVTRMVLEADRVNIGLPDDGESFYLDTATECVEQLEVLREKGYRVPQEAIDALREEAVNSRTSQA